MSTKIYLFGDSIGKGVIFDENRKRYMLAPDRCVKLLMAAGYDIESHTCMGATIRDGFADFVATETLPGSICAIEFGGNDCDLDWQAVSENPDIFHDGKTPLPEFSAMLDLFIRTAKERDLSPWLILPPPLHASRYYSWVSRGLNAGRILHYLGDVEHIYRWEERYSRAVRDAALRNGVTLLDLRTPFLESRNFPSLICLDGIHPSRAGQELMAHVVLSGRAAQPA